MKLIYKMWYMRLVFMCPREEIKFYNIDIYNVVGFFIIRYDQKVEFTGIFDDRMCQTDITNNLMTSSNEIHYPDICDICILPTIMKTSCIMVFIIFISNPCHLNITSGRFKFS